MLRNTPDSCPGHEFYHTTEPTPSSPGGADGFAIAEMKYSRRRTYSQWFTNWHDINRRHRAGFQKKRTITLVSCPNSPVRVSAVLGGRKATYLAQWR